MTGTVGVLVVSPPVVMPDQIVLYNHVNFTAEVKVIGGSGHFCYELEQQANVSKVLQSENAQLQVGFIVNFMRFYSPYVLGKKLYTYFPRWSQANYI